MDEPAGPTVPKHGIVVLEVSRPANAASEQLGFAALTEAAAWLEEQAEAEGLTVQRGDTFNQPGRVRFWLNNHDTLPDEQADHQAKAVWEQLLASVDEMFHARLAEQQAVLDRERSRARDATAAAQEALRSYRVARRGLDATPESRREEARLNFLLDKAIQEQDAAEVQAKDLTELIASKPPALRRTN
ncbi:MAG: hypothetical protein AAGC44_15525 [Planctomycetota bacterium]